MGGEVRRELEGRKRQSRRVKGLEYPSLVVEKDRMKLRCRMLVPLELDWVWLPTHHIASGCFPGNQQS